LVLVTFGDSGLSSIVGLDEMIRDALGEDVGEGA
jgi:hypothetical protein